MPSANAWRDDLLSVAKNYCDTVELDVSGKHIKIVMTGPTGVTRSVITSATPSDHRSLANTIKSVKKVAAAIGAYR